MKKFGKGFLIVSTSLFLILALTVGISYLIMILRAPDIDQVDATPKGYLTTILDEEGNVLNSLADAESNRVYVELDKIPLHVQQAFIAIEDARFYQHHGVDLRGIVRAAWKGIKNGFHFTEGASTITQQLLKNNVFTGWLQEGRSSDKIERKVQEQFLATQLEKKYNKEWILENYLNTINLGGGTRGVEVAANYYFGKSVWELTQAEAAMIAGITKNPSTYNPFKHPEESKGRQELVLLAMKKQEYLSEEEYQAALSEDVLEHLDINHEIQGGKVFNWFEDALLWSVVEDLERTYGLSNSDAWNKIYSDGLSIYTTENVELQQLVEEVAANDSWFQENQQISMVMLDVKTGGVAAIVGGRGAKEASLLYNRATESERQPGSTIKVIGEYAAGLEHDILTLGTTFDDKPYTYSDGTEIHNSDGAYHGMTTVRSAIVNSNNIVALQAFSQVGMGEVLQNLKNCGITTLDEADAYEPLAIGGTYHGITNLEMAGAYNTIASGGLYIKPYYYTQVLDHEGRVILSNSEQGTRVLGEDTSALLTSAMQDVMKFGTGQLAWFEGVDLAGKSGTTNNMRDLWFVGFSPYYTLSIWGGYDDNSPQEDSSYIKEIWKEIMYRGHEKMLGSQDAVFGTDQNLVECEICTKCGSLAIAGLCDSTEQGNMTTVEYFKPSTEPTAYCSCHVAVTICSSSGKPVGDNCPAYNRYQKIYLVKGSEGTDDAAFVNPFSSSDQCASHEANNWWPWNRPEQTPDTPAPNDPVSPDPGQNKPGKGNSWKDWFSWFW